MMKSKTAMTLLWMLIAALAVLWPTLAFAGDEDLSETGQAATGVVQLLLYAVSTIVTGLLGLLFAHLQRRFKIEADIASMLRTKEWIDHAIHYAEEWGTRKIKDSQLINGNSKLDVAFGYLNKVVADQKLLELGEEKLKLMIEARLNQLRSPDTKVETSTATPEADTLKE